MDFWQSNYFPLSFTWAHCGLILELPKTSGLKPRWMMARDINDSSAQSKQFCPCLGLTISCTSVFAGSAPSSDFYPECEGIFLFPCPLESPDRSVIWPTLWTSSHSVTVNQSLMTGGKFKQTSIRPDMKSASQKFDMSDGQQLEPGRRQTEVKPLGGLE